MSSYLRPFDDANRQEFAGLLGTQPLVEGSGLVSASQSASHPIRPSKLAGRAGGAVFEPKSWRVGDKVGLVSVLEAPTQHRTIRWVAPLGGF